MTFRDDHDAALARADALEQQLEKARDEASDARAALAKSEAERRLGTSPLTKTREEWIMEGVIGNPVRMEARLADQTLVVRTPLDGMGCSSTIYRFAR